MEDKKKILIAITGASGSGYGVRLVSYLLSQGHEVHLIISDAGQKVMDWETGLKPIDLQKEGAILYSVNDILAPLASGTCYINAMVICPCTMGTLSAVANGLASNLIQRAADVTLKEKRKLILVTRETPIHQGHIENMLKVANMGGIIMPATPGFYHRPKSVDEVYDFMVARVMDHLHIAHDLITPWQGG